jgi:hypothetical protein
MMKVRETPLPEEKPSAGEAGEVELVLPALKTCKYAPNNVPKNTALLYDNNSSTNPNAPHFRGVISIEQQFYWIEASIRENEKADRLVLELTFKPKH